MKKGITLLEVLVTIAIIGIISAISAVTLVGYLSKANRDADKETIVIFNQLLSSAVDQEKPKSVGEVKEILTELGYDGAYSTKQKNKIYVWNDYHNKIELIDTSRFENVNATYNVNHEEGAFYISYRNINYYLLDDSFIEPIYNLKLDATKVDTDYDEKSLYYKLIAEYLDTTTFYNGRGVYYKYSFTSRERVTIEPEHIQVLEGVETLLNGCFKTLTPTITIRVASSVKVIEDKAFYSIKKLKTVFFSNDSKLISIGNEVFSNCQSLDYIIFPDTLEVIGDMVFYNCLKIRYIKLSKELKSIGINCFKSCKQLEIVDVDIENINFTLFDGVLYSGDMTILYVYPAQKKDHTFTVMEGVKEIYSCAFSANNILTKLYVSDTVEVLGQRFVENCTSLVYVKLSSNIKAIQEQSFYGCLGLKEIDIPDGVEIIEDYAFAQCNYMTKIYIPNTVQTIGKNAFKSCTKLTIYTGHSKLPQDWTADFATFSVDVKYNQQR